MTLTYLAHLKAAPEYLEFLRAGLRSPDMQMTRTSDGDALVLTMPTGALDTTQAWNEAEAVVRHVCGALNVFANLVGPISVVAPVTARDQTGRGTSMLAVLTGTVRIFSRRGRERLLESTADGRDTVISRLLRLAKTHKDVARALDLLHDHEPSWSDIYLLMEIVEVNLRFQDNQIGKDWVAIAAQGWLPARTIRVIKRNAGFHRHAKQFTPPQPPISLSDAQVHCKHVVREWLDKLATG